MPPEPEEEDEIGIKKDLHDEPFSVSISPLASPPAEFIPLQNQDFSGASGMLTKGQSWVVPYTFPL